MNKTTKALNHYWGYQKLRKGQAEAVEEILNGKDTLIVLPTGGGKSICYQLPALLLDGICLVISPLIALMQDQVDQLKKRNIKAVSITSNHTKAEIEQILLNARNGLYKLLYVSPERLKSALFKQYVSDLPISFIAIDEAHCISEWGHEFRPAYREIVHSIPPAIQKVAVTATATPEVQLDIASSLGMQDPKTILGDFMRPNLKWWAKQTQRTSHAVIKAALNSDDSGLIFCDTRKKTHFLSQKLVINGTVAEAYHGGLEAEERKSVQNRWIQNETQIVCCTNAFGMGIDKPDCRFVLHSHLPESLEAYYQEAGRAGRDGELATPALYFSESEYQTKVEQLKSTLIPEKQIKTLYNAIHDDLDFALNAPIDPSLLKGVDLKKLEQRSKLGLQVIKRGLKNLEDLGLFSIHKDSTYQKATINLLNNRFDITEQNEKRVYFLDKLKRLLPSLRRNDGIIQLSELADALQLKLPTLIRALEVLHHEGRVNYKLIKDEWRIIPSDIRIREPNIDYKYLEGLLNAKLKRFEWVYKYATTRSCRSIFIAKYFGQKVDKKCGVCDNCRKESARTTSVNWAEKVYEVIPSQGIQKEQLLTQFKLQDASTIEKALRKLLNEKLIIVNKEDLITKIR